MNINTSSLSTYTPILKTAIKSGDETVAADAKSSDATKLSLDMSGTAAADESTEATAPKTIKEQIIQQLKEQIEQVEKQLQQQQQQLAAAQNSKGSEQEKLQRIMAIQQQISGTMAQLTALQGSLLQAMAVSVKTTA